MCEGVVGPDVPNTKFCCGFLPNVLLFSDRRHYCAFLLRYLKIISLINVGGGGPHLFSRSWTPKHSSALLA
jgi:hypothetical protein